MSQVGDDVEIISECGTTSDEWIKEGSSDIAKTSAAESTPERSLENPTSVVYQKASIAETPPYYEYWTNLLGVRNKPNLLSDWDNLYNLKNQSALRKDCRMLLDKVGKESTITLPQLESLVTLYCKRRNVEYESDCGWLNIFEKLIVFPFQYSTLFNVFYAITTKYIPRSSKAFDLFRLIIQYHDPELCSYLDSLKVQPEDFACDWFKTLLSKGIENDLCCKIWNEYFEKGDPFLVFFIALAFVRCVRDEIFALKCADDVKDLLKKAPTQMSIEDVADLLHICYVFLNFTPISVRQDFHCLLFGSNLVDEFIDFPLNRLMCLPISVQELYKRVIDNPSSATAVITYFVIDTRSQKSFNTGCIPGSYNLNGNLIVDEPEKFNIAMSSLMNFKEDICAKDHICFIGSGKEDDDSYMMMVISRFLQQNKEHISYVDGGFKALHAMLFDIGSLSKLSNHFNVNDCAECASCGQKSTDSTGWSLMERMKKAIQSKTKLSLKLNKSHIAPLTNEPVKHVSADRFGKRYRNVQSVFSINDDSQGSEDELNFSNVKTNVRAIEKLKWIDVIKKPEIVEYFQGHEVFPDKSQVSCFIALSRTHMHIFHAVLNNPGFVQSSLRHALSSVMHVTSKKKIPEFLTFKFGYELPTGESHINSVHCFIIPKAGDCAKAVKIAIVALKSFSIHNVDQKSTLAKEATNLMA